MTRVSDEKIAWFENFYKDSLNTEIYEAFVELRERRAAEKFNVLEDLECARILIETPDLWRQGLPKIVYPMCTGEALSMMTTIRASAEFEARKQALLEVLGFQTLDDLIYANDDLNTSHEDVLSWFDAAIAKLKDTE